MFKSISFKPPNIPIKYLSHFDFKLKWTLDRLCHLAEDWYDDMDEAFRVHITIGCLQGSRSNKKIQNKQKKKRNVLSDEINKSDEIKEEKNDVLKEDLHDSSLGTYRFDNDVGTNTEHYSEEIKGLEEKILMLTNLHNDHLNMCGGKMRNLEVQFNTSIEKKDDEFKKLQMEIQETESSRSSLEKELFKLKIKVNKFKRKLGKDVSDDIDVIREPIPVIYSDKKMKFVETVSAIKKTSKELDSVNYIEKYENIFNKMDDLRDCIQSKSTIMILGMFRYVLQAFHNSMMSCYGKLVLIMDCLNGSTDVNEILKKIG